MTGRAYSEDDFLDDINEYDPDDAEAEAIRRFDASVSFPGAQYFDEIMHKKKQGKKVGKFKIHKNPESDF